METDYQILCKSGILLCQQITTELFRSKEILSIKSDLKPESLLHRCGYNVHSDNALSTAQRHEILRRVIDSGLYSVIGVCSHLDWLISRNKNVKNRNMTDAIAKWEEDRLFVSNYQTDTDRTIGVKSIKKTIINNS